MSTKINQSKPTYLKGYHYNIPLKKTWNTSLLAGLRVIADEIVTAAPAQDIHEVSVERIDDMAEFKAQGDIGYSVPAQEGEVTDYYLVDFTLSNPDALDEEWYQDNQCIVELNNKLSDYLVETREYQLSNCHYSVVANEHEEGMALVLRAYFVRSTQQS